MRFLRKKKKHTIIKNLLKLKTNYIKFNYLVYFIFTLLNINHRITLIT